MEVPEQRRHILYIEGEPRWEYKFIRRAIDENPAVRVASLLKTTPNKFYRQGVESPDELTDGFPTEELALFRYDALMIGSFEAAALTRRAARHDPRVREPARRQPADARRPARPHRRRLGADERRRGAAGAAAELDGPSFVREPAKAVLDRRRPHAPR